MWSQSTNVTDRQTDGRTDGQTDGRHAIARPRFALKIVCPQDTRILWVHLQGPDLNQCGDPHVNFLTLMYREPGCIRNSAFIWDPASGRGFTLGLSAKTRILWLSVGEETMTFCSFWYNTRVWQTDGQTDRQTNGHQYSIATSITSSCVYSSPWLLYRVGNILLFSQRIVGDSNTLSPYRIVSMQRNAALPGIYPPDPCDTDTFWWRPVPRRALPDAAVSLRWQYLQPPFPVSTRTTARSCPTRVPDTYMYISFLFARCRPTRSGCGAARAGTVVLLYLLLHAAADNDTALGNMLINHLLLHV